MRTYIFMGVLALTFFIPFITNAAVVINEIAWMGTAVSATDEWIELHNDGVEDVSLSGWKLVADDGAPLISLSGTISAGGYYLLERTDDTTVPEIAADKIYTGDLGNAGETLTLFDDSGTVVDTVSGGTNWESVGGYNETKDTPQRQPDATWLTGVPTPKALNTTVASELPSSGQVAGASASTSKKKPVTGGYKQVVFAYAGQDVRGVTGAALRFEGYAVSDKNTRLSVATYRWSFGDGAHAKGKEVTHSYEHQGTYTAVLKVTSEYQQWQDTITVNILDALVQVVAAESGERGYIELQNDMDEPLDLSNWKLAVRPARKRLREKVFTLPEATLLAPHTSVRFPARITSLVSSRDDIVILQYPSGASASEFVRDTVASTSPAVSSAETL